jgi:hypothetical protein
MEIIIPFSYVIFIWYILYKSNVVSYNPFWWLWIGLITNILQLSAMVYYHNDALYIILFCLMNFFLKILPIYSLWDNFYKKIQFNTDIFPGFVLLCGYLLLLSKGSFNNVKKILEKYYRFIQENRPFSPFVYYVSKAIRQK